MNQVSTMAMPRCTGCGERLPPTSGPAHVCGGPFGLQTVIPMHWSELAIREIVREEMRAAMQQSEGREKP